MSDKDLDKKVVVVMETDWKRAVENNIAELHSCITDINIKINKLIDDTKKLKMENDLSPRETIFSRTLQTVYEISTRGMRYYFWAHIAKIVMFLIGVYIVVKAI